MNIIERFFENVLWNSRLLLVIPVIASLFVALGVLVTTSLDALYVVGSAFGYLNPSLDAYAREAVRIEIISEVVGVIDGYLLAAILLIFALGIYELFVNKIDAAEGSEFAGRLLLIVNLDDLKDRLAKVILVILIVKFFQAALNLKYETAFDLLMLATGILFIGAALYLSSIKPNKDSKKDSPEDKA
ncbi:MAG: YqhA family protein [bacterium]|nr:YqhA family protein [bacterium]